MDYRKPQVEKANRMRRIGNLYDKIISVDNLILADKKARKGKRNTYGVQVHDKNIEANIYKLHDMLATHSFKTSKYDIFIIHEPKERVIFRLPYFPDRILHHAIMNVLEPIWVPTFIKDTYCCVKGRGIHGAMRSVIKAMKDRENTKYCLKIDIRKFYPSIDHDVLKSVIRRKIKCKHTLALIDEIIDSSEGLPIGNYLSQYLSNLILTYFDHWIKEVKRVKHYFRYADDMVFLSSNKEALRSLLSDIKQYLRGLKLELKGNEQIFPVAHSKYDKHGRGIDFVGYVFYHEHTSIRKYIKKNMCRKAHKLNKNDNICAVRYKQALCSWLGWSKHCDSTHLLKTIIKPIYYETCLLRQRAA